MCRFEIISLTPIATGDYKKRNSQLLPTGLIGSLRYQYWLMKSMEASERLDPCIESGIPLRKELDPEDFGGRLGNKGLAEALSDAGPVVQLFGTTGWKRPFALLVQSAQKRSPQISTACRKDSAAPYQWKFFLAFSKDRELDAFLKHSTLPVIQDWENEISKLMRFVHGYGWLGAAPQNGFGWVKVSTHEADNIRKLEDNCYFYAKDICVDLSNMKCFLEKLRKYYQIKIDGATNEKRNRRYNDSLQAIESCIGMCEKEKKNNADLMPIGFEIRRYLKHLRCEDGAFGDNENASYIHISHPVVRESEVSIRIRYCARPGRFPYSKDTPRTLVEWCEGKINSG